MTFFHCWNALHCMHYSSASLHSHRCWDKHQHQDPQSAFDICDGSGCRRRWHERRTLRRLHAVRFIRIVAILVCVMGVVIIIIFVVVRSFAVDAIATAPLRTMHPALGRSQRMIVCHSHVIVIELPIAFALEEVRFAWTNEWTNKRHVQRLGYAQQWVGHHRQSSYHRNTGTPNQYRNRCPSRRSYYADNPPRWCDLRHYSASTVRPGRRTSDCCDPKPMPRPVAANTPAVRDASTVADSPAPVCWNCN